MVVAHLNFLYGVVINLPGRTFKADFCAIVTYGERIFELIDCIKVEVAADHRRIVADRDKVSGSDLILTNFDEENWRAVDHRLEVGNDYS